MQAMDEFDLESVSTAGSLVGSDSGSTMVASPSSQPATKKRKHGQTVSSESSDFLRDLFINRPKPGDFIQQRPRDDLQSFCDNMCDTMRKFEPLAVAKIKLEIAQIVSKHEIEWAEAAAVAAANKSLQITPFQNLTNLNIIRNKNGPSIEEID